MPALSPKPYEDPETIRRGLIQQLTTKIRADIEQTRRTCQQDIEQAISVQQQLQTSENRIKQGVQQLLQEKSDLQRNNAILSQKVTELREWLQTHERSDENVDVDAITEPKDPLAVQALTVLAEDAASEDGLHVLDRALQQGTIDLPTFLRRSRFLAEEQFNKRVLSDKITAEVIRQQSPTRAM